MRSRVISRTSRTRAQGNSIAAATREVRLPVLATRNRARNRPAQSARHRVRNLRAADARRSRTSPARPSSTENRSQKASPSRTSSTKSVPVARAPSPAPLSFNPQERRHPEGRQVRGISRAAQPLGGAGLQACYSRKTNSGLQPLRYVPQRLKPALPCAAFAALKRCSHPKTLTTLPIQVPGHIRKKLPG